MPTRHKGIGMNRPKKRKVSPLALGPIFADDTSEPEELCPAPKNKSDCVTNGVRVKVSSYYVPSRSSPHLGQFFFTYKVSPLASCAVSPPTPIFPSFLA